MINRLYHSIFWIFFLNACGNHGSKKSEANPVNSVNIATIPLNLTSLTDDSSILGSWFGNCIIFGNGSKQQQLEIQSDLLIRSFVIYSDYLCKTPETYFRNIGEYRVESGRLNSKLFQTHIRIEDENIRRSAEKSKSCGFDKWMIGTWQDVTNRTCNETQTTGGVWTKLTISGSNLFKNSYEIQENELTIVYSDGPFVFKKR